MISALTSSTRRARHQMRLTFSDEPAVRRPRVNADELHKYLREGKYVQLLGSIDRWIAVESQLKGRRAVESLAMSISESMFLFELALTVARNPEVPADKRKLGYKVLKQVSKVRDGLFAQSAETRKRTVPPEKLWEAWPVYLNTVKSATRPGEDAVSAYMDGVRSRFAGKTRSSLTREFLDRLPDGQLAEFTVDKYGAASVGVDVNHSFLADGKEVGTAGGLRLFRTKGTNEIAVVVLGAFSGHYNCPEETLELMAKALVEIGIPRGRILFMQGDPAGDREIENLDGAVELPAEAAQLIEDARRLRGSSF
jgi:hypothetical protein